MSEEVTLVTRFVKGMPVVNGAANCLLPMIMIVLANCREWGIRLTMSSALECAPRYPAFSLPDFAGQLAKKLRQNEFANTIVKIG